MNIRNRWLSGALRGFTVVALMSAVLPQASAAQTRVVVEGRVLEPDGQPSRDAVVRIVSAGRSGAVGEDGRFRFESVPLGSYLLEVESESAGRAVERIEVGVEGVRIDVTLRAVYHMEEVVVSTGSDARRRDELFQAVNVLSGRDLRNQVEASLGETLSREPGVTSSYFGPASSRPVIRGLSGDRVRILEGGVGTGDASNTSPDHAVGLEPGTADRIEVIRGPATLLYGSSAIGGVVNVLDGRVPSERPVRMIEGELSGVGGTVSDELNTSGRLSARVGPFVWQARGLVRDTDDYQIPGHAELEEEEGAAEEEEGEEGILENSALKTWNASTGISWVSDHGFVGISFSGYENEYGVPGGHGHEEEEPGVGGAAEEEEGVSIDMRQRRLDIDGEWRFAGSPIRSVKARVGGTNYRHFEIEDGAIGTRFDNDSWEARFEAQHGSGAFGLQLRTRDFQALGEEAFIAPNETDEIALFGLQRFSAGPVAFQVGARWEGASVELSDGSLDRDLSGFSVSTGVNWSLADRNSVSLSLARSVKQPTAEELFSNGPHLATNSFDLGDSELDEEVGWSVDLGLHGHYGRVTGEITGFLTDFSDFIFQGFTGAEEDELPVLQYMQADAFFGGIEGRAEFELVEFGNNHLGLEVQGDWVRAELSDSDEPLPRIPPFRIGGGLRLDGAPWQAEFGVRRVTVQDRVAEFETTTDGYTMIDARLGYRLLHAGLVHELVISGRNLSDNEARNHVSLLKNFAPLPGRNLQVMYRVAF